MTVHATPRPVAPHASTAAPPVRIRNAMTVDVEDYFHVQAFADVIPRAQWEKLPARVEANVDRILEKFANARVHATFFTLGWIAERHPSVVRRIVAAGHELASHGHGHARVDTLDPVRFRADVRRAKRTLEDIGATPVVGYRAPTFSIGPRTPWAFDVLESEGHSYSSSLYPIRHDLYGTHDAPRVPFQPAGCTLWEIPMTTLRLLGQNLPTAGGGYFRLIPYELYRTGLRRFNSAEGRPGVFYFHPWEIDPKQPRVRGVSNLSRFRHYVNIPSMSSRLDRLLWDFAWDRLDRVFAMTIAADQGFIFPPATLPS